MPQESLGDHNDEILERISIVSRSKCSCFKIFKEPFMTSENTDAKVAIDKLAPFISELTSRVFDKKENLEEVIRSIASRIGVTPEQVALYTSLLNETLEPTLRMKSVLDQKKSQHIIELGIQPDIKLEVNLGFYEAIFGCEKEIRVSRLEIEPDGDLRPSSKKLKITVPAGVIPDTRLRIAGEGNICIEGEKAGDVYLHLALPLQADGLMREGDDIVSEIKITALQSQTGVEVRAYTIYGEITIQIPVDTADGHLLTLKGRGVPKLGSPAQRGDHFVRVVIEAPPDFDIVNRRVVELRDAYLQSELKVLQTQLLQRTNGDRALVSRLVEYERRNNSSGLEVDLYRDAIARLERDQSGFI